MKMPQAQKTIQANGHNGLFISFEGGDGCGKSTHINFLESILTSYGYKVVHVREPGGTQIGERLRDIVLDADITNMAKETELLIYEAARAQIVNEVILPALNEGAIVISDRFLDSTVAYQHYGRQIDRAFLESANEFATCGLIPDITILLTCSDRSEKRSRVDRRESFDRLELAGDDFHTNVIFGFEKLAEQYPERIKKIDTKDSHSKTALAIFHELDRFFPWLLDGSVDLSNPLKDFDEQHKH